MHAARRVTRFDERELDIVDGQRIARVVVEVFEGGERQFGAPPADRDAVATALQRDVERLLDLPQIFVERSAEVGEPRVVFARCGEFQMLLSGLQGGGSILSVVGALNGSLAGESLYIVVVHQHEFAA